MDFRSRSEERSIHAFRAALKHRTLNIAPYSFGKGAPFCAPQQSGRFCRSSTTPHFAPWPSLSSRQRAALWPDEGPASYHPALPPSIPSTAPPLAVILSAAKGSLFDFNFLPRTPIHSRVPRPSFLRRVGVFVEARPTSRAAAAFVAAVFRPPSAAPLSASFARSSRTSVARGGTPLRF